MKKPIRGAGGSPPDFSRHLRPRRAQGRHRDAGSRHPEAGRRHREADGAAPGSAVRSATRRAGFSERMAGHRSPVAGIAKRIDGNTGTSSAFLCRGPASHGRRPGRAWRANALTLPPLGDLL